MFRALSETAVSDISTRNPSRKSEAGKWSKLQTLSFIVVYCSTAWALIIAAIWWAAT